MTGSLTFKPSAVHGVTIVQGVAHDDMRGSFRRLWCAKEFGAAGLTGEIVQVSISHTRRQGTLRGIHFQLPPSREAKLVQCLSGRIYDVAVDLRPRSPSFRAWFGVELEGSEPKALFIPEGCGHGFLTLTDDCSVLYLMTDFYDPALSRGVRWDDPSFDIRWPNAPLDILERDRRYPDFDPALVKAFDCY